MLDFDAMEILNRFSVDAWLRVRSDWFALLNRGIRITGTGNADSHTAHHERVGYPVNLVTVAGPDTRSFVAAISEGRVRVSSGPLVELRVDTGRQTVAPGHQLIRGNDSVVAKIQLRAAPWVPVPEVRLIHNGAVVFQTEVGGLGPDMTREWEVPLSLTADAWLIAEAGWSLTNPERPAGTYAMVAPGHVPIGFTNPIWLDVDGDEQWGPIEVPEAPAPQGPLGAIRQPAPVLEPVQ
jgi:hypothetical protein